MVLRLTKERSFYNLRGMKKRNETPMISIAEQPDVRVFAGQVMMPDIMMPLNPVPLHSHSVSAGFPSPADDYVEDQLDLNEFLIRNKPATFFLRVKGDSMLNAGIHDGDIIVVDRSLRPVHRSIVVAVVDGELTVKRLHLQKGGAELHAENPQYEPILLGSGQELMIWGVVTCAVHTVR